MEAKKLTKNYIQSIYKILKLIVKMLKNCWILKNYKTILMFL